MTLTVSKDTAIQAAAPTLATWRNWTPDFACKQKKAGFDSGYADQHGMWEKPSRE